MNTSVNPKFSCEKLSPLKSLTALASDWLILGSCVFMTIRFPSFFVYIPAFIIIAARQHALLVLFHDGVHGLLNPSKIWNDRIARWLIAYPFLFNPAAYSHLHFEHHAHMNTENDPNWLWKEHSGDWVFPKTKIQFLKFCLQALNPYHEVKQTLLNIREALVKGPYLLRHEKKILLFHLIYFSILGFILFFSGHGAKILFFWFMPMFTLLPLLHRLRSVAEHHAVKTSGPFHGSRNYRCNLIERFFLAPHNVSFHLDHHIQPDVPFYRLPALHKHLTSSDEYNSHSRNNTGYLWPGKDSVLSDVLGGSSFR